MFMTPQSWALLIYYIYNICCWSGKGPRSGGELLTTTLLSCSDLTYGYENSYSEQFWLYPYLINGKVLALGSIWDITHWLLLFPPLVPSNPTSPYPSLSGMTNKSLTPAVTNQDLPGYNESLWWIYIGENQIGVKPYSTYIPKGRVILRNNSTEAM